MLVCDHCKDVSKKAFIVNLVVKKHEKAKPRTVITVQVHACDECLSFMCVSLGTRKSNGSLFR